MLTEALQIGFELAALPLAFWLGRRRRAAAIMEEPRCAGYEAMASGQGREVRDTRGRFVKIKVAMGELRTDCRALRSPMCMDGRCTFHCAAMCKCDVCSRDGDGADASVVFGRRR